MANKIVNSLILYSQQWVCGGLINFLAMVCVGLFIQNEDALLVLSIMFFVGSLKLSSHGKIFDEEISAITVVSSMLSCM